MAEKILIEYQTNTSKNLRYLLNLYSISMLELSQNIKVAYSSIYDILENKSNPTIKTLIKISEYFNITLSQLVGDIPINQPSKTKFKKIPLLNWTNIPEFIKTKDFNNKEQSVFVSINKITDRKIFALTGNKKTEPVFPIESLLIFEECINITNKCNDTFVLIKTPENHILLNKILFEGTKIFIQPINDKLDPYPLEDNKIIACLIQSIINF